MAEKYRPVRNEALAAAMRDLRRSNAAVPYDSRPKRERSRDAVRKAEIRRSADQ